MIRAVYVARANRHGLLRYPRPTTWKEEMGVSFDAAVGKPFFFPSRVAQCVGEVASSGQEAGIGLRVTRGSVARIRCAVFSAQVSSQVPALHLVDFFEEGV